MRYTAFILSLWSGLLAAAGTAGQIAFKQLAPLLNLQPLSLAPVSHGGLAERNPLVGIITVLAIYFLPILVSAAIALPRLRAARNAGEKLDPLLEAAVLLDVIALLYAFILYPILNAPIFIA